MKKELTQIAREAGSYFEKSALTNIESKAGHANFVTNIDCAVQAYLEKALTALVPDSRFIGEEKENQSLTDALTWIVDPLDGTTNMIHDYRQSAVSIALCEGKKPVVGLIWQPFTRELFYAEVGKGASLNDAPIRVSDVPPEKALVAVGTAPYYEELERTSLEMALSFLHECADIRRSGSAALDLAYLACGRHDIYFELRLKPWDFAAGSLIVQEAGGFVCMPLNGQRMDYDLSTAILAATPACREKALAIFERHAGGVK
ncbi:MAG: inositol monophosphatase [Clostridia bacterium]|nr:inositol monophosphatase [Clostridia bacterium]